MGQNLTSESTLEEISLAFWMGCLYGEIQTPKDVESYVKRGVDINSLSPDGMTGLHCAAQHGNVAGVRALLLCGVG